MKALFADSRQSLGSRTMNKKLREEGFEVGRYQVRRLMKEPGLVVKPQRRYKARWVQILERVLCYCYLQILLIISFCNGSLDTTVASPCNCSGGLA